MRNLAAWLVAICIAGSAAFAVTLTGTVTGPDGAPLPDAQVWLYRSSYWPDDDSSLVAQGGTDQNGQFALDDPGPAARDEEWYVYAYFSGLAVDGWEVKDPAEPVILALGEPGTVSGQIVDPTGNPLAGAVVTARRCRLGDWPRAGFRRFTIPEEVGREFAVRTNDAGRFELGAIPQDARTTLGVTADGYGQVQVYHSADISPLCLRPAGSLRGRIVCAERPQMVAGVRLRAHTVAPRGETSAEADTITDAEGNFLFPELPPGRYDMRITRQPGPDYHVRGRSNIAIRPGEEKVVELAAEKTYPVWGRVIAADTGEGVAGGRVMCDQWRDDYSSGGTSDAEGLFEIPCLPGQTYLGVYGAEGYLRSGWSGDEDELIVSVALGGAAVGAIELHPSYAVTVLVVDEQDNPVPGAQVRLTHYLRLPATDEHGLVELEELPAKTHDLRAEKEDLASEIVSVRVGEDQGPVCLVLKAGLATRVTVRIVDQKQTPARDALARLWQEAGRTGTTVPCNGPDEDGRVWGKQLAPGATYWFRISAPGASPAETDKWMAQAGVVHDFGTVVIIRYTGVVGGEVTDEAGRPVANVSVSAAGDVSRKAVSRTDAQGRFRLEGLIGGPTYLFVDSPQHQFTAARSETGTLGLRIVLTPRRPAGLVEPLPPPQSTPDNAQEIARSLLLEALAQTKGGREYNRMEMLKTLAAIDPKGALQAAAEGGDDVARVKVELGRAQLVENFDQAVALIKGHPDHSRALSVLVEEAKKLQGDHPQLALKCLTAARAMIRSTTEASAFRAYIGAMMVDLGDETGLDLIAQAEQEVSNVERADVREFAYTTIALTTAERDLEKALLLLEFIQDQDQREQMLTYFARRLAKTDPDQALTIVRERISRRSQPKTIATILPFFPEDQFERAVQVAQGIEDDFYRALALGRLSSVAPPPRVPQLIAQAAEALLASTEFSESRLNRAAQALASLACVARRRGYDQYQELAARAVALRSVGYTASGSISSSLHYDLQLARILAFSHPELARVVINSALTYAGGWDKVPASRYSSLAAAAAEVDVDWALALLAQMPPDAPGTDPLHRGSSAVAIAKRLLTSAEEREEHLLGHSYLHGQWLPVEEDW